MEIVAEFTYNHFGNIERAKRMIDSAKDAGATCVKFELRNNKSYFRNNIEIREKREKFEFSDAQIAEFARHCQLAGIDWFASLHDIYSVNRILPFSPKYLKIASREARNEDFLFHLKELNDGAYPVIISTGGLSMQFIEKIYSLFSTDLLTLVHTSCLYPCPVEDLNINRIKWMMESFDCNVGYSGHEVDFLPSLYAIALGVNYLERHFTLEEEQREIAKGMKYFNDEFCTLSPSVFRKMVNDTRVFLQLRKQPLIAGTSDAELERINAYGKPDWDGNDIYLLPPDY